MNAEEELAVLDVRIRTLLPAEYRDGYEQMQPTPMKSAPLKLDADGSVAWNEMWSSFCDLAMAGGPPHKGALLSPGDPEAISADRDRYAEAQSEICRGIRTVTSLEAQPSPVPGWIRVTCLGDGMAGWLLRAIVMENVAARAEGSALDLPAGPAFRLEQEIRNVVTVASKTCHYWMEHMPFRQQREISALLATMNVEAPLVVPGAARAGDDVVAAMERSTGLRVSDRGTTGWLGLAGGSVRGALWRTRALVAYNVLARREGTTLYVPFDDAADPSGARVADAVARVDRLAHARGIGS